VGELVGWLWWGRGGKCAAAEGGLLRSVRCMCVRERGGGVVLDAFCDVRWDVCVCVCVCVQCLDMFCPTHPCG